jgi:hypothetical protein
VGDEQRLGDLFEYKDLEGIVTDVLHTEEKGPFVIENFEVDDMTNYEVKFRYVIEKEELEPQNSTDEE